MHTTSDHTHRVHDANRARTVQPTPTIRHDKGRGKKQVCLSIFLQSSPANGFKWNKSEPLAELPFIFFPINQHEHWRLLLVYNLPRCLQEHPGPPPLEQNGGANPPKHPRKRFHPTPPTSAKASAPASGPTRGCMLVLDSLRGRGRSDVELVKKFLRQRLAEEVKAGVSPEAAEDPQLKARIHRMEERVRDMWVIMPKLPHQVLSCRQCRAVPFQFPVAHWGFSPGLVAQASASPTGGSPIRPFVHLPTDRLHGQPGISLQHLVSSSSVRTCVSVGKGYKGRTR